MRKFSQGQAKQAEKLAVAYAAYLTGLDELKKPGDENDPEKWGTVWVWAIMLRDAQNATGVVVAPHIDGLIDTASRKANRKDEHEQLG